jgi:hypothetical protein
MKLGTILVHFVALPSLCPREINGGDFVMVSDSSMP